MFAENNNTDIVLPRSHDKLGESVQSLHFGDRTTLAEDEELITRPKTGQEVKEARKRKRKALRGNIASQSKDRYAMITPTPIAS